MAPSVSRDVEELAAQFGLRPTRLLQAGPGRSTVQVRDDDGSLFVLKTATDPGALAGDVDANLTLSAAGLPVPEIIDHRVGPPSVLLLRWIEGDPISSASSVRTQREVGRLLRAVHTLPGAPPFSGQPTIAAWILPGPRKWRPGGPPSAPAMPKCSVCSAGSTSSSRSSRHEKVASRCSTAEQSTSWYATVGWWD